MIKPIATAVFALALLLGVLLITDSIVAGLTAYPDEINIPAD